jgi:hypothetical protein
MAERQAYAVFVQPGAYDRQWADLRQRLAIECLIVIAGMLTTVAAAWLLSRFEHDERWAIWVAAAWLVPFAWSHWRVTSFRCPRCGWRWAGWFHRGVPRKCSNCGLVRDEGNGKSASADQ